MEEALWNRKVVSKQKKVEVLVLILLCDLVGAAWKRVLHFRSLHRAKTQERQAILVGSSLFPMKGDRDEIKR